MARSSRGLWVLLAIALGGTGAQACTALSGRSIVLQFTACPNIYDQTTPACVEGRLRYAVVGRNVLEYIDDNRPQGLYYNLDSRIEVGPGHELAGAMQIGSPAEGGGRGSITASLAGGTLQLVTTAWRMRGEARVQLDKTVIVRMTPDCSTCELSAYVATAQTAIANRTPNVRVMLMQKGSCQIRNGV